MKTSLLSIAAIAASLTASAVELPHIFGDNMVLQREQRVPVWGKGAPGEKVTVAFAGQKEKTLVGADGKWRIDLKPLKACADGADFTVRGDNEVVFTNVVVGEVWFCSGQSNMEFPVGPALPWDRNRKIKDADAEIAAANCGFPMMFTRARQPTVWLACSSAFFASPPLPRMPPTYLVPDRAHLAQHFFTVP